MTPSRPPSPWLRPAVQLMQGLRLPIKMSLIGTLIALPLTVLTLAFLAQINRDLSATTEERAGAAAVSTLLDVAVATQTHRGQTNLAMTGSDAAERALVATRQTLRKALADADQTLALHPDWPGLASWSAVRQALESLAQGQRDGDRAAVFAKHSQQVQALRLLVERIGEDSGLLYDPEPASFFLMDLVVERMLPLTEGAGLLRGQGAGLLGKGSASADELAQVNARLALLGEQREGVQRRIAALLRAQEPAPAGHEAMDAALVRFEALARQSFSGGAPRGEAQDYFRVGTQGIDAVVHFARNTTVRLSTLLDERAARLTQRRNLAVGAALLGLLIMGYMSAGFYVNVLTALRRVGAVTRAGAEGNLALRAQVPGRDEFADMGRELDAMNQHLATLVQQIRGVAHDVAGTGQAMQGQSQELASRTTEQAATVEESAATLEQVANTVRSNAHHVGDIDQLFHQVRETGASGRERMQQAVETVEGIAATSRRVSEIVSVIDGIAFQTNILALNAAVEAARAGESGRGFAVVASEVRTLAQRSASAASEIRQLISTSTEQVESGVGEIHRARDSMGRMLEQVAGVGGAIGELSTATREQTLAVDQVATAVRQIGDVTSHNAHSAEATSGAADTLRGQADSLLGMVQRLTV